MSVQSSSTEFISNAVISESSASIDRGQLVHRGQQPDASSVSHTALLKCPDAPPGGRSVSTINRSSEGNATKATVIPSTITRRLSAVPWVYAAVGCILTIAVVATVVVLQYGYINSSVERMVEDRAGIILQGGINSITAYNNRAEKTGAAVGRQLMKAGNSSTSPVELLDSLNTTLYRAIALRTQATPTIMGYLVSIVGPPVPPDNLTKQELSVQNTCPVWCRRPEDPLFTEIAEFAIFRDHNPGANEEDEFRYIYSYDNVNDSFSKMYRVNRSTTAPSWAVDPDGSPSQLKQFTREAAPYRVGSGLSYSQNGTTYKGMWVPVVVTTTPLGRSYYFLSYRQAFVHPLNNLTVIVSKLVSTSAYQSILTQYAKQVGGDNGHLILVDGLVRVIGYNKDPYGDSRLANCTITFFLFFKKGAKWQKWPPLPAV